MARNTLQHNTHEEPHKQVLATRPVRLTHAPPDAHYDVDFFFFFAGCSATGVFLPFDALPLPVSTALNDRFFSARCSARFVSPSVNDDRSKYVGAYSSSLHQANNRTPVSIAIQLRTASRPHPHGMLKSPDTHDKKKKGKALTIQV